MGPKQYNLVAVDWIKLSKDGTRGELLGTENKPSVSMTDREFLDQMDEYRFLKTLCVVQLDNQCSDILAMKLSRRNVGSYKSQTA
jgi:hypothetical protein